MSQMKTEVITRTKKIDTNYVFSENNQVYLKCKSSVTSTDSNTIHTEEWFPISFCWES